MEQKRRRRKIAKKVLKEGSKDGRPLEGNGPKKPRSIRLEDSIFEKICKEYGSLSLFIKEVTKKYLE